MRDGREAKHAGTSAPIDSAISSKRARGRSMPHKRASARKAAAGRVKLQLILAQIAEREKLTVTNDDLNDFIYREAMRSRQKPDKLAKSIAGDNAQIRAIQQSIIFDKAVEFVVSKAKVTTVTPKA